MGSMEDEHYFHRLSRKELQDLCRKNGLPANLLKSRLANMLATRYKDKNKSSATLEERSSGPIDGSPITVPALNVEPEMNPTQEKNKEVHNVRVEADDVDGRRSPTRSKEAISTLNVVPMVPSMNSTEVYGFSSFNIQETASCSLLGHQCDNTTSQLKNKDKPESDEPREDNHNMMGPDRSTGLGNIQHNEGRNKCDNPTDSSINSRNAADKKPLPNFEFYTASEEGINLFVDFNWNPSDFIKRLNDGVCVHPKVLNDKSGQLHKELNTSGHDGAETEASLPDNTVLDSNNKGDLTFTNSLLDSIVRDVNHVKPNKSDESSVTGIKEINIPVATLGLMEQTTQPNSSLCEPNFDVHNPTDMCDKSSPETSEKHSVGLVVPLTSQIKSTGNHIIGSKSDGTRSIDSMDYPSKNCNTCPENIETDTIGTSCTPGARRILSSSDVLETMKTFTTVHGNGSGLFGGFSAGVDSVEKKLLEVEALCEDMANSHYQNGESLDLNNPDHYLQKETGNSAKCELDLNKSLDPLSEDPEEQSQQRSNPTNELESFKCSQFDMKVDSYKRSSCSDSDGLQNNSKKHRHNEDSNHLSRKTSSSSRTSTRKKSHPRRSMRLVSK